MQKKIIAVLVSVVLMSFGLCAQADGLYAMAQSGNYSTPAFGGGNVDASAMGVTVGKQLSANLAIEADYLKLGNSSDMATGSSTYPATIFGVTYNVPVTAPVSTSGQVLSLSAVGELPVSGLLSVYGKVGVSGTTIDRSSLASDPLLATADGFSKTAVSFGVGVQVKTKDVIFRIGANRYDAGTQKVSAVTMSFGSYF